MMCVRAGRSPATKGMGLENTGVTMTPAPAHKIVVDDCERTTVPNIYALGDCIEVCLPLFFTWLCVGFFCFVLTDLIYQGRPELTPVAIKARQLLARRYSCHSFCNMRACVLLVFSMFV